LARVRRRDLVVVIGTTALAAWRPAFSQSETRRVGALFSQAAGDPEGQARAAAFRQGLAALGWSEDKNLRIDFRWAAGSHARMQALAEELVSQKSEVILAAATVPLVALQRITRTVPIVFAQVTDPVGAGFVASLARPGGNITGLTQHEFGISEKWLELLKQIAPHLTRVAVLYDPGNQANAGYLRVISPAAPSFGLHVSSFSIRDRAEITRAIEEFAKEPGGVILLPGTVGSFNRDLVISLAARHRLPTIFAFRYHAVSGGLVSYGVDNIDLYRRAAWYVDRILKGAKPSELPVEHANKFQLVINLKTARAIGLTIPNALLTSADEVIE
jgi:putative ABC transport system substrate-binding protein